MPQIARIKLISTELKDLEAVCANIKDMSEKMGISIKGPISLPTKKMQVVTRKAPAGEGTHSYDKWELRVHRRLIDIDANERTMAQLTRINIPTTVNIEVRLKNK
ncbi:MAG: 30S ribosomal protein S10 [Nitrososphaerota archaeon]|jgi:small subunit ribosomal protein S10|nr:30S ribosomal protein S10 [Nitrososphaerota archaeon]MDG7039102.1 30S ribosomal protein S10 [Nitrososphaerota archaeon]MDG7041093.1 30S ribosomal protein S10 [Nitrososphaerota archaeon]MDG7042981.1 30S ribosomal protein S10 [Nitrososphaerota archaeon]MDG7043983.1 30S ribosomal protein S10 [Nitrososphaerota archaeon]